MDFKARGFAVLTAALIVLLAGVRAGLAESDTAQFDRFEAFKTGSWPCPGDENAFWQANCTNLELGDVSGYISPAVMDSNATGRFLSKYWGTQEYLKFVANGCARAATQEEAKSLATYRAHELIKKLTGDFNAKYLVGKFETLGYRKYDEYYNCTVRRPSTNDQLAALTPENPAQRYNGTPPAARQGDPAPEPVREAWRDTALIVKITNLDKYAVEMAFYSKTNEGHAWPGGDQVYIITDSEPHTYKLSCQRGEKICFGAWRRGNQRSHWGSGYRAREACTSCCLTCGMEHAYTLDPAGDDAVASGGSDALDTLNTMLGAAAMGVNAANAMNAARAPPPSVSAPSYRPAAGPDPQGLTRNKSDISGTR